MADNSDEIKSSLSSDKKRAFIYCVLKFVSASNKCGSYPLEVCCTDPGIRSAKRVKNSRILLTFTYRRDNSEVIIGKLFYSIVKISHENLGMTYPAVLSS